MKKVDELWLCWDCTLAAANNEYTSLSDYYLPEEVAERRKEIEEGLEELGPNLVYDVGAPLEAWVKAVVAGDTDEGWESWVESQCDDSSTGYYEFSRDPCDCCGSQLAGSRFLFTKWEEK